MKENLLLVNIHHMCPYEDFHMKIVLILFIPVHTIHCEKCIALSGRHMTLTFMRTQGQNNCREGMSTVIALPSLYNMDMMR